MDLKTYFQVYPITQLKRLASACGTSYPYLYQMAKGYRNISDAFALRLEQETYGEISVQDIHPDKAAIYGTCRDYENIKKKEAGASP